MTTATVPTLPNATEAQVRRALEIAGEVYERYGLEVRLEPVRTRDPEIPNSDVIEIYAWLDAPTPDEVIWRLISAVPQALRAEGIHEPEVAIASHIIPNW